MNAFELLMPEIILIGMAGVLMLMGASSRVTFRRIVPVAALAALLAALIAASATGGSGGVLEDSTSTVRLAGLSRFIRPTACLVGMMLLLMAWPTKADATGNDSIDYGTETGEFFGLALLSIAGVLLVAAANDIILLFLALELVSIPTYIMVSISRRNAAAQEAGVKYFFLGAMAAAIMLFGFSYLYGVTGATKLSDITAKFAAAGGQVPPWAILAVVMLVIGFAFKMAAAPLHFYAGDVYEGAATPVTAFLAFVPKTAGFLALVKVLFAVGGGTWVLPPILFTLIAAIAVFTMFIGNVLGLLQQNVKRVLAYSSVAHSGYMLIGVAAQVHGAPASETSLDGLGGVLFYLVAYGVMNAGAFGVLMLIPARRGGGSAETFDDLAGWGKKHPVIGMGMAISCFSLIGLPLTAGFWGKFMLLKPAFERGMGTLVILTLINAAISAAYYLKIVATMFLRTADEGAPGITSEPAPARSNPFPIAVATILSVSATLCFGIIPAAMQRLSDFASHSTDIDSQSSNAAAAGQAAAQAKDGGGEQRVTLDSHP